MRGHNGLLGVTLIVLLAGAAGGGADELLDLETCEMCHDELAASFVGGPHGRAMQRVDAEILARSCVTCHEATAEHVDDPSADNVRRQPGEAACIACHQASANGMGLATPAHTRHSVGCRACHGAGHEPSDADHLLLAPSHEMCANCHQAQASRFALPYAHRNGSEPFDCTACHEIHGLGRLGRLAEWGNGGACVDCHTGKAGPFIFPHPPREVDGCVSCHTPHGSTNPRQLTRHRVLNLCLECHADVPSFHDISRTRYQSCQTCHAAVHGSNRSPQLFDQ